MPRIQFFLVAVLAAPAGAIVSDAEKTEMLDLHNMYRCMADVPPLQWDTTLATAAQSWADTQIMSHSTGLGAFSTYGENMQYACPTSTVKDATTWWHAEIDKYTPSNPWGAAHYTQMVWKNAARIGCGKGPAPCGGDSWVCQFKAKEEGKNLFGNNPYANGYEKNVLPEDGSKKAQCGGSSLYSRNVPNVGFAQSSAMLGAAAFFAVTAFFTVAAGFRLRQTRRAATLAASELEPLEAGEEGFCPE